MNVCLNCMKAKGLYCQLLLVICLMICFSLISQVNASEVTPQKSAKTISVEYLSPTKDDRNIETVNFDFNVLAAEIEKLNLSTYVGVVGTYATGDITQLEGDINQGTLREVNYKNSAFGVGPGILLSFRLIEIGNVSFSLNGSGHFILYNKRFPAGGDYYNFMWRGGPVIEYKISGNKSVGVSYQESHVSNGQGVSPDNPSYDASGFALRYTSLF